jgi:hypothetical protein
MTPRVSVVIPLYQTERYIGEALASVLGQTYRDFEVIVVDDGSRDGGPAIARACPDPRILVVTQENRGLAGARNTGIRVARGKLIALLDADDLWEPAKLACHVAAFDADPNLDVSFSASRLIDENGCDIGLVQRPLADRLEDADFFCRNPVGNGSAPVIRRRALERIAFLAPDTGRVCWFDESFRQSEDVECWMRLKAEAQARFGYLAEPLTRYRVNSGGLSANVGAQLATWTRFRDKVASYAPDLVAQHGARAEGYQLRYLARRAVRSDDRAQALGLALRAVRTFPRMLIEEPARTIATLAAALAKRALPSAAFEGLQSRALGWLTRRPGLRV